MKAKYDVGDQLFGQQGGTARGGEFDLYEWKLGVHDSGEKQDDTTSLRHDMPIPSGPRIDRYTPKRVRGDAERNGRWTHDMYESVGGLQYD